MVCDTSELRNYPSKALAPCWSGPWTVLSAVNNVVASVRSDFKHKLGLPETVKLMGIDRLLAVPKNLRWEDVNILDTYSREARDSVLEQGWLAIDLFAEVIEGADPSPRLNLLGVNPAEVDQSYDEADGEERDDGEESVDEDHGDQDQGPGGGMEEDPSLAPVDPGSGQFRSPNSNENSGVTVDPSYHTSHPAINPSVDSPTGPAPPPLVYQFRPSPPMLPGEDRNDTEHRILTLPDGSQYQASRHRSRISRPSSRNGAPGEERMVHPDSLHSESPIPEADQLDGYDLSVDGGDLDEEQVTSPVVERAPSPRGSPAGRPGLKLTFTKAVSDVNRWFVGAKGKQAVPSPS